MGYLIEKPRRLESLGKNGNRKAKGAGAVVQGLKKESDNDRLLCLKVLNASVKHLELETRSKFSRTLLFLS